MVYSIEALNIIKDNSYELFWSLAIPFIIYLILEALKLLRQKESKISFSLSDMVGILFAFEFYCAMFPGLVKSKFGTKIYQQNPQQFYIPLILITLFILVFLILFEKIPFKNNLIYNALNDNLFIIKGAKLITIKLISIIFAIFIFVVNIFVIVI